MNKEVIAGAIYRHFKGNHYVVVGVAIDSDTKEEVVVYKCHKTHIWFKKYGEMMFTRTFESWFDDVSNRQDNVTKQTQRFEKITKYLGGTN